MAESGDFSSDSVKDLLRATIVVLSYEDVQGVIDEIERVFTLARDPKTARARCPFAPMARLYPQKSRRGMVATPM